MNSQGVRARFRDLGVWQHDGERAPYKPLLLLYALGRYAHGARRLIEYERIDQDLAPLFREFGPPSDEHAPIVPFWEMRAHGVWEVPGGQEALVREGQASEPTKRWLRDHDIAGGLPSDLFDTLAGDVNLMRDVAGDVLVAHFPSTLHAEILAAVGLDAELALPPASRDPKFHAAVVRAYERRCAVCAFDARMGDALAGLDAAHIRWPQAGGPATVDNGMALCSLHHKLFDRGSFTLTEDRRVLVSEGLHGSASTEQWIARFHGHRLRMPRRSTQRPSVDFIGWHRREVFREPGRSLE